MFEKTFCCYRHNPINKEVSALRLFPHFDPLVHVLTPHGFFTNEAVFKVRSGSVSGEFEEPFSQEVFKALKPEGKINPLIIANSLHWHYGRFNVNGAMPIWPRHRQALENPAPCLCQIENGVQSSIIQHDAEPVICGRFHNHLESNEIFINQQFGTMFADHQIKRSTV